MKTYATLAITAAISGAVSLSQEENLGDLDLQNRSLNFYDATIESLTTTTIHNYYACNEDGEPVEMSDDNASEGMSDEEAAEEAGEVCITMEARLTIAACITMEARLAEEDRLAEEAFLAAEEAERARLAEIQRMIAKNDCINTCLDLDSFDFNTRPAWYQMGAFVDEVLSRTNHQRDAGLLVQGKAKTVRLQNIDRNVVGETINSLLHGWSCYGPGCTNPASFSKTDILSYEGHPVFVRRQFSQFGYYIFSVDSNGNDKHGFHTTHHPLGNIQNFQINHNDVTDMGLVGKRENEAYWKRDGTAGDMLDCESTWTNPDQCARTWAFGP